MFIQDTVLLKQKKRTVLDITGFFFRMSTQVKAEHKLMRKKKPVISHIRANSFVSIIMYLTCSVVEKIYGMAYIFTLLMFRKPNKTTINKNKMTNFYRSTFFRFSFIFRYFKVFQVKRIVYIQIFQVSQIFTCGLSDLLILAVGSLVVFVLRE